jgi:hypothetical protein
MERLLERCAALDVHQASVTACVRVSDEQGERRELNERFGTTTPDLLALCDWLRGHGVTHVAMEGTVSTGSRSITRLRASASCCSLTPPTSSSGSTGRGSPWLRSALVESALAATRTRGYLRAKYWRIRQRRGHQRAVIAVAHAIPEIGYQMISTGELYRELGDDFFERRDNERATQRHLRALERLGYRVTVTEVPAPEAA